MTKRLLLLLMFFGLSVSPAWAGLFGPFVIPGQGEISQEVGLLLSVESLESDLEAATTGFADGKMRQNHAFVQVGYGLGSEIEAYFRLGAADLTFDDGFVVSGAGNVGAGFSDMEGGWAPFATAGVRGLVTSGRHWDLAAFAQGSYYGPYEDEKIETGGPVLVAEKLEVSDLVRLRAGAVLQTRLGGTLLYGGPTLGITRASIETRATALSESEGNSNDYSEEQVFGGLLGLSIPLGDALNLTLEADYQGELSIGGSVSFVLLPY